MNLINYFKDTIRELKLVRWPSREETLRLTALVIGISIFVGVFVGGLDLGFTSLLSQLIK